MHDRVRDARVAVLATIAADGEPHLVPITFALEGEVLYTAVDSKPKRTASLARLANIERDPRVTVLVQHYEDDWTRLWWVRADGTARIVPPGDERERALRALGRKYERYREEPPAGKVMGVDVGRWSGWAYGEGGGLGGRAEA